MSTTTQRPGNGQTKKRSGAADLEIQQGSLNGGAKSCRFGGSLSAVLSTVGPAKVEGIAKAEGPAKADSLSTGIKRRSLDEWGVKRAIAWFDPSQIEG